MPLMSNGIQINITATDDASPALRSVQSSVSKLEGSVKQGSEQTNKLLGGWIQLSSVLNVAGFVLSTVSRGVQDTWGAMVKYTQEVRNMSDATGMNAEESSRMIQVMDRFNITTSAVETAFKTLSKNGLEPNITTLAKLADKYNSLASGQEKMAFLQKQFGESGMQMASVLSHTGDELRKMNSEVDKNLILTDEMVARNEKARISMEKWTNTVEGWKIKIGGALGQAVINQESYNRAMEATNNLYAANPALVWRAADAIDAYSARLSGLAEQYAITGAASESLEFTNQDLISTTMSLQRETDNYDRSLERATEKMAELKQKQAEYVAGSGEYDQIQKQINETAADISNLATAHEKAGREIAYNLLIQKLGMDGLSDAEFNLALNTGIAWGLIDQSVADAASGMISNLQNIKEETMDTRVETNRLNSIIMLLAKNAGTRFDFYAYMHAIGDWSVVNNLNRANNAAVHNCFIAGTLITMMDGTLVPIESVGVGDWVKTFDVNSMSHNIGRVSHVHEHPLTPEYLLINDEIGVTTEHPLFVNGDWVEAGKVRVGDMLMGYDKEPVLVTAITSVQVVTTTYNLTVDNDHNYFADGILAHNKAGGGLVRGGGTGFSDAFLAPLADGEFVMRSAVVRQPGMLDHLNSLNSGGRGSAGGAVSLSVNVSSFISLADQRDAEAKLTPIIERAIRNAQGLL